MAKFLLNSRKASPGQKCVLIIFGIFLFFVFLEIGLRLAAFAITAAQEYRNKITVRRSGTFRIVCIGESTTAGGGKSKSYPYCLEEILNQRQLGIRFSVINKGKGGANSTYLLEHLEEYCNIYKPNLVLAMIGVNDQWPNDVYQEMPLAETAPFLASFRTLRLLSLLSLHIATKLKELESPRQYSQSKDIIPGSDLIKAGLGKLSTRQMRAKAAAPAGADNDEEESLKKAIALNPADDKAYLALGVFYKRQSKFTEAEEFLVRATKLNPQNDEAYIELGQAYHYQLKNLLAENAFKKAIALNPQNESAYTFLAVSLHRTAKFSDAVEVLREVLGVNPGNVCAHRELGRNYAFLEKPDLAEKSFKAAIALDANEYMATFELGKLYMFRGDTAQAEAMFKKAKGLKPDSAEVDAALTMLYPAQAERERKPKKEEGYAPAKETRKEYYISVTRSNYLKIKELLDKKGISLVCVQYPMRSVEPLKKIFPDQKGLFFVDNEKIFKDAINREGYDEYFIDLFAGDFGHCSLKGNKLLAENAANVILKEYFRR